jgi:RecB family exonuclease
MAANTAEWVRLVIGRGPRAVEETVLARIMAFADAARSQPDLLGAPVLVVVPSGSLRRHLAARLVAGGRALAGVRVLTLHGLARQVLAWAGEEAPLGGRLLPVLVERAARGLGDLRAPLEPLAEGYAVLTGTVRDLLDAGFTEDHADPLDERLADLGESDGPVARARSIVRLAADVSATMRALGVGRSSTLLARAAELLRGGAGLPLPARAVVVHGFAEATGVASDLIEAALRAWGGTIALDEPADPADPSRPDLGVAFTARLRERLEPLAGRAGRSDEAPGVAATLEMFRAPGLFTEAREVAERIRALLDGGARPEGIGIVARELGTREIALHQHLRRLAVPYSCDGGAGLAGPASRRLAAMSDLLAAGPAAPAEAWFRAAGSTGAGQLDVRLAARVAGLTTVAAVAELDVAALVGDRGGVVLPVGRVLEGDDETVEVSRTRRRFVTGAAIERARGAAAAWLRAWQAVPATAPATAQVEAARRLATLALRAAGGEAREAADDLLADLASAVPASFALERHEALALAAEAMRAAGRTPSGGAGAGVQVLGAVEARARTFEHLFVTGLNRDSFPRVVREDPLLPDRIRQALAVVLPDLPLKRGGFDEERFLFAQLVSAAPHVTLSWLECDDDGRATPPSPLVERLLLARKGEPPRVADLYASGRAQCIRPPHEHLVLAGLAGQRNDFRGVLPLALGAGGVRDAARVAGARCAVLDEVDPDRRGAAGRSLDAAAGPYLGYIGAVDPAHPGPRGGAIAVTTLQDLAACPWQTFLRRLLRIEEPPESAGTLPSADRALVGSTVHRALEILAGGRGAGGRGELEAAVAGAPHAMEWPAPEGVEEVALQAARDVLRDEAVHMPALAGVLAVAARPFLAVARALDEGAGRPAVLAAEVAGRAVLADGRGGSRELVFRADRVEAGPGRVALVDFKTGTPPSVATTAKGKRAATTRSVARGAWLQGAVYTRSRAAAPLEGRYVFLAPDIPEEARSWTIEAEDGDAQDALDAAVASLVRAWDEGAFFPRLVEPSGRREPKKCGRCPVRAACLAGDSGVRRRLLGWAATGLESGSPAEHAALALWRIGSEGGEG